MKTGGQERNLTKKGDQEKIIVVKGGIKKFHSTASK